MGSIAELLGYSLSPEDPGEEAAVSPENEDRIRETAMAAVLEETPLEAGDARGGLRLIEDLDIDDLVRYAIVARIEHELGISIPDQRVEAWTTLEDLLDGVVEAKG